MRTVPLTPEMAVLVEERTGMAEALAVKVWKTYRVLPLDELKSQAFLGLVLAAERWPDHCRENYGTQPLDDLSYFNEFCRRRIFGACVDWIRAMDPATRTTRRRIKQIKELEESGVHGADLEEQTGLSTQQILHAREATSRIPSPLDAVLEYPEQTAPRKKTLQTLLQPFLSEVRKLAPLNQLILALYFYQELTLKEISVLLCMPDEHVSEVHGNTIEHLLSVMESVVLNAVERKES